MANFVILAPRTAGLPMVLPPPPLAPPSEAPRASLADYDGHAQDLRAFDASPSTSRARGMPTSYHMPARRFLDEMARHDSSSFATQRLAQESDPDPGAGSRLLTAIAAYHRARDSYMEILSSFPALDIRV